MTPPPMRPEPRSRVSGETYFFRDHGQFQLLRERLLPMLFAARVPSSPLRIWSAGCSTGEEAYSLAIVLNELRPAGADGGATIIGTDVDDNALIRARRGVYPPWSFRMVDAALRDRYFARRGAEWELAPSIRAMVTFRQHDLLRDALPSPRAGLRDLDLILCRNVFIYFPRPAVTAVPEANFRAQSRIRPLPSTSTSQTNPANTAYRLGAV